MAVTAADLIAPRGKLQEGLFPDGNLATNAAEWLNIAGTKLAGIESVYHDAAKTAYAYYLAYSHVADRLAGTPNSASVDSAAQVQMAIGKDRIAYFASLANKYLEEWESYVSTPTDPELPRSTWVQNRVVF